MGCQQNVDVVEESAELYGRLVAGLEYGGASWDATVGVYGDTEGSFVDQVPSSSMWKV